MTDHLLKICLLTGDHATETALIPQITLSPSLIGLNFAIKLNRHQFPVQLTFALTINKSQGQTIKHIGINLREPVFTYGTTLHCLLMCNVFPTYQDTSFYKFKL